MQMTFFSIFIYLSLVQQLML